MDSLGDMHVSVLDELCSDINKGARYDDLQGRRHDLLDALPMRTDTGQATETEDMTILRGCS